MTIDSTPLFREVFPFPALVGQDTMKLALILNVISPKIGGALILGEKGTAKSTAVRGLGSLLPRIRAVQGCPYACASQEAFPQCPYCSQSTYHPVAERPVPLVTLPLNTTEDRLLGGIDFEIVRRIGRMTFQPGLLAAANRGILYIDEVNLMDDHLVDVLLDAAANGENRVEREGISFSHPSSFTLVATMNPEEGQLRPQLLDRFGLCVRLSGISSVSDRLKLMERREQFDSNPAAFVERYRADSSSLAVNITEAQRQLPSIHLNSELRQQLARIALDNQVAGHRADLVMADTAVALAAWHGRAAVTAEDLETAAALALPHRRREVSPVSPPADPRQSDFSESESERQSPPPDSTASGDSSEGSSSNGTRPSASSSSEEHQSQEEVPRNSDPPAERVFAVGEAYRVRRIEPAKDRRLRRGSGRRSRTRTPEKLGRYVRAVPDPKITDLALDATLRAAAPRQKDRLATEGLALTLRPQDFRSKVREKRVGHFVLFLVDASGSMGARGRMTASKGAVLSLLLDAYQKRDKVAMVSFRGRDATVNLPPTASVELAARHLQELPVGGRTPLAAGLAKGWAVVERMLRHTSTVRPIVVLLTDGKANQSLNTDALPVDEAMEMAQRWGRDDRILFVVVDTEPAGLVRFGLAQRLAEALGGDYHPLQDLRADTLLDAFRRSL